MGFTPLLRTQLVGRGHNCDGASSLPPIILHSYLPKPSSVASTVTQFDILNILTTPLVNVYLFDAFTGLRDTTARALLYALLQARDSRLLAVPGRAPHLRTARRQLRAGTGLFSGGILGATAHHRFLRRCSLRLLLLRAGPASARVLCLCCLLLAELISLFLALRLYRASV